MDRATLQSQIKNDLPEIGANICLGILDDLLFGEWDLNNISFANLCFWADDEKEVLRILPYITGDCTRLLDLRMYRLEGDQRIDLNEDQMRSATRYIIHQPENTDVAGDDVFIYFCAGEVIKNIRNNNQI